MGLLVTAAQRRVARLWGIPALALFGLGLARLIAGSVSHKPIGFLTFAVAISGIMTFRLFQTAWMTTTRGARTGIDKLRRGNRYLAPQQSPAYLTPAAGAAAGTRRRVPARRRAAG